MSDSSSSGSNGADGAFPNDATAWGVGVLVGGLAACLILGLIALCFRRILCPPRAEDNSTPTIVVAPANEDRANNALEVESTGSQDRVRPHVGAFATEGTEKDRQQQLHSDPEEHEDEDGHGPPPHSVGIRSIAMAAAAGRRRSSQANTRIWRY